MEVLNKDEVTTENNEEELEEIANQDEIPRDEKESLHSAEKRAKDQRDSAEKRKKKKGLKEEEVEQQIDEAGCGSHGKREDKKKRCPHCDGDAPESECINKPQKKSMKESEETVVDTTSDADLEEGYRRDADCEAEARNDQNYRRTRMQRDFDRAYGDCVDRKKYDRAYRRYEESKVMTPEKEKMLKENYMGAKRQNLFERLVNKWAK